MPWYSNPWVNRADDLIPVIDQEYRAAQQRVMEQAMQQAMNDAARAQHQQHLEYERLRLDPYATVPPRRTRNEPNIVGILNEFNTAFNHGIREVVVSDEVYHQLMDYFNAQVRFRNEPDDKYRGQLFLTLNTDGGPMKIMPESYKEKFNKIDFDAYLEDVE